MDELERMNRKEKINSTAPEIWLFGYRWSGTVWNFLSIGRSLKWSEANTSTGRSKSRGRLRKCGVSMKMHKMADRHCRSDGVVGLPWPVGKRRSWEIFAVRLPHPRKLAPKHDPSQDIIDTGPDSRGRTFYRVKRQLETQNRARRRERCFNPSRRRPRVLRYASFAHCNSANFVAVRLSSTLSANFGDTRRNDCVSITSRSKPTAFTHDSFEHYGDSFLSNSLLFNMDGLHHHRKFIARSEKLKFSRYLLCFLVDFIFLSNFYYIIKLHRKMATISGRSYVSF